MLLFPHSNIKPSLRTCRLASTPCPPCLLPSQRHCRLSPETHSGSLVQRNIPLKGHKEGKDKGKEGIMNPLWWRARRLIDTCILNGCADFSHPQQYQEKTLHHEGKHQAMPFTGLLYVLESIAMEENASILQAPQELCQ